MSNPLGRLRIVLVSPRNPLNIGAAARAISNFGFSHLRLVNAYEVAYQEARSAVNAGAILTASQQFETVAAAVADCSLVVGTTSLGHRELAHPLIRLEKGGLRLRDHLAAANAALLFGSEKFGLSNEDMSHCHWLIRIPTRPEHESMNLGQAVAICLYELIRENVAQAAVLADSTIVSSPAPADAQQVELFSTLLLEALTLSGYTNPVTSHSQEQKLRRLVRRLALSRRDAYVWLGMLRQILWKLRNGPA